MNHGSSSGEFLMSCIIASIMRRSKQIGPQLSNLQYKIYHKNIPLWFQGYFENQIIPQWTNQNINIKFLPLIKSEIRSNGYQCPRCDIHTKPFCQTPIVLPQYSLLGFHKSLWALVQNQEITNKTSISPEFSVLKT